MWNEFLYFVDDTRKNLSLTEKFNCYLETGSFPYVLKYRYDGDEAKEYMRGIYNTILLNGVVKWLRIADVNMLVRGRDTDIGHILENMVYLELRRRNYEVYIGQLGTDGEVDFVAMKDGGIEYYQVSQTTLEEHVLKRELAPLRKIQDNYPKYLLTLDELFGEMNYEGIQKKNVLTWMIQG